MNLQRWISLAALLCFFGVLLFLLQARSENNAENQSRADSQDPVHLEKSSHDAHHSPQQDPRLTQLPDGRVLLNTAVTLSQELHQSEPEDDLPIIARIIEHYRQFFGENPDGSENGKIVAQLLGENNLQLVFLDPDHVNLSASGELLDQWGSPYLFQPFGTSAMEILSPGPDRVLWTQDDLLVDLPPLSGNLQ